MMFDIKKDIYDSQPEISSRLSTELKNHFNNIPRGKAPKHKIDSKRRQRLKALGYIN